MSGLVERARAAMEGGAPTQFVLALVPELLSELAAAEGKLAAIRELVDGWKTDAGTGSKAHNVFGQQVVSVDFATEQLLAILDAGGGFQ